MTARTQSALKSTMLMLACAAVVAGCANPPSEPVATSKERYNVTVRWTAYGVPHIKAEDWGSLGYGMAYAVATDGVCTLAREFVNVRGEQAKFFGPEEGRIEADVFHKSVITKEALVHASARVPPEMAAMTAGYVAGYNRYLADHPGDKLPASCRNQPWVRPIDGADMARMGIGVGIRYGVGRSPAAIANAAPPSKDGKTTRVEPPATADATMMGSNAIALGKAATVNGRGMVLGNPHYPWTGSSRFHMAHLTIPNRIDVMGVGLISTPFISIGFNRDIAWSHTVSSGLRSTMYELTLDPNDPLSYRYGNETRKLTARTVSVEVRQPDGALKTEERTTYFSHFGAIIEDKDMPWTREHAYAIRDSNLDNNRSTEQYLKFALAKNVDDILKSLQTSQGTAWVNTVAADRDGKALYADLSVVPNVDAALIKACASEATQRWGGWRVVVLRGAPECEWRVDQRAQQPGILPPQQMPHLIRDDYVTNSNDSYWLSNPAQPLEGFSPIIGPENTERSLRTRAGLVMVDEVLKDTKNNRFDSKRLQDLLFNHRNYGAELALDDVLSICKREPKTVKVEKNNVDVSKSCEVLAGWDRRHDITSRGAHIWTEALPLITAIPGLWQVPFDAKDAVHTPRQIKVEDANVRKAVMLALATATQKLNDAKIPLDASWGDVQFTERNGERIGLPGGTHAAGVFSVMVGKFTPGKGYSPIVTGNSWMQVVTWNDAGDVDAHGILSYSQSEENDSPHVTDQTKLYSKSQWLKLPFTEQEIASATVSSIELKGN